MQHRFSLDKSPRKYVCPNCGKRRFVRYLDNETGNYLPDFVGRCDRENNCQHHFTPKMYFDNNPDLRPQTDLFGRQETPPPPLKGLSFISPETLRQSLTAYDRNNFVKWLHLLFDAHLVTNLVERFNVGTSKQWNGATVFWQVDTDLKVRQAKVMLYHPITGKRLKEDSEPDKGKAKVYFAGKSILRQMGIEAPELRQCFFGEHQLSRDTGQILAIAESEKTAILMTAFARLGIAPNYTWLATGGKNGARWTEPEVSKVLTGRKIVLFPDLRAFDAWKAKSYLLTGCRVVVSDILEKHATQTDRENGLDIADFYLRLYQRGTILPENLTKLNIQSQEIKAMSKFIPSRLTKILPPHEKILAVMLEQNPLVGELMERFNLEIEER